MSIKCMEASAEANALAIGPITINLDFWVQARDENIARRKRHKLSALVGTTWLNFPG